MNVFQTTKKQEMHKNSIKLYANLDDADALIKQESFSDEPAVVSSFVQINCYAVVHKMYPLNGPFNAFKYCTPSQVSCMIVGGLPTSNNMTLLTNWTGSSYCVRDNVLGSDLHSAICYNQNGTDGALNRLDPVLSRLQRDGIMLIPEALSTFEGGTRIMSKLWEPFIWNYLFKMSNIYPDVPILFTTESAKAKFSSAVLNSQYRFNLVVSNHAVSESSDVLACIEKLLMENGQKYFNFLTKSLK